MERRAASARPCGSIAVAAISCGGKVRERMRTREEVRRREELEEMEEWEWRWKRRWKRRWEWRWEWRVGVEGGSGGKRTWERRGESHLP